MKITERITNAWKCYQLWVCLGIGKFLRKGKYVCLECSCMPILKYCDLITDYTVDFSTQSGFIIHYYECNWLFTGLMLDIQQITVLIMNVFFLQHNTLFWDQGLPLYFPLTSHFNAGVAVHPRDMFIVHLIPPDVCSCFHQPLKCSVLYQVLIARPQNIWLILTGCTLAANLWECGVLSILVSLGVGLWSRDLLL
jgi:hypothetical protein